jgi:hypothetical protein
MNESVAHLKAFAVLVRVHCARSERASKPNARASEGYLVGLAFNERPEGTFSIALSP